MKKTTLLLTLLSASALNVFADPKVVTSGTEAEADKTYTGDSTYAALQVSGSETWYSGTRLTLSGITVSNTGRYGAYVYNQGRLDLHDITSVGGAAQNGYAAYATGSSIMTITGGTFTSDWLSYGVYYTGSSIGRVANVHINTTDLASYGLVAALHSQVDGQNLTIETFGTSGYGVFYAVATGAISGLTVVTHNMSGFGIAVEGNGTLLEVENFTVLTEGNRAKGAGVGSSTGATFGIGDGTLILRSGTIVTTGSNSAGAMTAGEGSNALFMRDMTIETHGQDAAGIVTSQGPNGHDKTNTIVMDGGSVYAENGPAVRIGIMGTTTNTDPDVVASQGGTYNITLTGSAQLSGTSAFEIVNRITGTLADGEPYTVDTMTIANVTVEDGVTLTGDTNIKGSSTATLNLDDSTLTGNINAIEDTNLTLSGSHGATITGTVSGNDNAIIDLTVSGTGSTILGDITQSGSSAVTVIIDNSATGQGGYHGGNLITGEDSAWTFDKNSHGNYGKNDGVWNIGDYEVIFDNMTHTGTLNLNVNTDTGAGGSIHVTGTADGEGTVHIDTTGDGKLNPNDVLPGIVSGEGTEHWQWDPIDWGIDTIIKDGDHFVKSGVSPAGAVLNSSVAIQQAMWFAQQNSLLKRMGELRYGARASRPLADKDVRVPYNLIENLWLRSYGQQLNIGSQVAGRAYEQLIYGVDLGTDHKFTISADSDLYLGVYAGYGRSDIDYRTPGTDGEINSYYGGLYATWLHSSGFYIDATFKAASVNNDLKAPYGNAQLKASYSDVNIGGSLELGKKFTFTDDWFIEPQFQVNYLHILAEDYTAGPMTISTQDLDALQLRIGSLFGRTLKLANGGALQPYVKISGVETISSGGTIRNGYQHTRANTDGARAELGAGLIWQLDTNNQLHLDYEAS
ncbi:MAG: autotransporter outer membrane beta-barrel domain-containing protein, partial [Verrucomicrobiales bacterium]|nr:autotransporter outer membrane beta-barrel domain-containing protein [Verrucomicrobiales bacterium]